MISVGLTDAGPVRRENQDAILMHHQGETGLFLVTDGVSSSASGATASRTITHAYDCWWQEREERIETLSFDQLFEEVKELSEKLNTQLVQCYGPGVCCSTMALLLLQRNRFGVLSAGDSRVYCYKNPVMKCLTRDDIWGNLPGVTGEERKKEKLLSAVGGYGPLEYSCMTDLFTRGMVFLLCSDGIYKFVEPEVLRNTMSVMSDCCFLWQRRLYPLVRAAVESGTDDNYSVIAVKV